jgi:hypothetical protein
MDSQEEQIRRLPLLREHDFRSSVPIIGPLIQWTRRVLYHLTAKWAVWVIIQQQNQINQVIEEWLRGQEAVLTDMDKDLTFIARRVAEIEIRQRYMARLLFNQAKGFTPDESRDTSQRGSKE